MIRRLRYIAGLIMFAYLISHFTNHMLGLVSLDAMEAALLALDSGSTDAELVHTIFRAAHSIKGGAATFGFAEVAAFTHVAESLLESPLEA